MNKLSLTEVIKLAVNEIQDLSEAKTLLEKSKSKVTYHVEMSFLKI